MGTTTTDTFRLVRENTELIFSIASLKKYHFGMIIIEIRTSILREEFVVLSLINRRKQSI